MFLPRFSTRTMLIILAVAALLFAIISQGLLGLSQRWEPLPEDSPYHLSRMERMSQISVWRQTAAAVSVAVVALALLMTINAVFFFIGWLLGTAAGIQSDSLAADPGDMPMIGPPPQEPPPPASATAAGVEDES